MDKEQLNKLIAPFVVGFDETYKKNYYYNSDTKESVWELPEEFQLKLEQFKEQYDLAKENNEDGEDKPDDAFYNPKSIDKFLPKKLRKKDFGNQELNKLMERPARKQVEESIAMNYAYKQGDQEYNVWYDKFLSDEFRRGEVKERELAATRCDPENDTGFTKADLYSKHHAYYCRHFAKGCCCEGSNCRFFHRPPTMEDSLHVDHSKDIFGRPRFANHREDMTGIGSFLKETRSLHISDFKMPTGQDPVAQMYEIVYRHFGAFGQIEDLNVIVSKGLCFIKFKHRCMAEFAKEAMNNQSMDSKKEVIGIKWAFEDPNESEDIVKKEDKNVLREAMVKRQEDERKKQNNQVIDSRREQLMIEKVQQYQQQQDEYLTNQLKDQQAMDNIDKMSSILDQIDQGKEGEDENPIY